MTLKAWPPTNSASAFGGIFTGFSVTTFALGTPELYDWLDGNTDVRFLPVELVNSPELISKNRRMISINGALAVDLAGLSGSTEEEYVLGNAAPLARVAL